MEYKNTQGVISQTINEDPNFKFTYIKNRRCVIYSIPRSEIEYIRDREELKYPALYILTGGDEVYIGQTDNPYNRISQHNAKKLFWSQAYICVSNSTDRLSVDDVKYLEHLAISEAKSISETYNSYTLKNKQGSNKPSQLDYVENSNNEFFNDIKFILESIGCRVFKTPQRIINDIEKIDEEVVNKHQPLTNTSNLIGKKFHYIRPGKPDKAFYAIDAWMEITKDGYKILRDSVINNIYDEGRKNIGEKMWEYRKDIITNHSTFENNNIIIKVDSKLFSAPSTALTFCSGQVADGWKMWKDESGQLLETYKESIKNLLNSK